MVTLHIGVCSQEIFQRGTCLKAVCAAARAKKTPRRRHCNALPQSAQRALTRQIGMAAVSLNQINSDAIALVPLARSGDVFALNTTDVMVWIGFP